MSGLNLEQRSMDDLEATEQRLRGEDVNVVFSMPDGQRHRHTFSMGHTVELLKSTLDSQYDIPYRCIKLFLNDAEMPDPLSLNDFPAISATQDVIVKVFVDDSIEDDEE